MYDVATLGELLIDFTTQASDPDGYPTMAAHPGGAPANFLAAIAKFGGKAALLGKVGTDTFGKLLTDTLRKVGIETKGLVASDEFSRRWHSSRWTKTATANLRSRASPAQTRSFAPTNWIFLSSMKHGCSTSARSR